MEENTKITFEQARQQKINDLMIDVRDALRIAKMIVHESIEDKPFDKPPIEIFTPLVFQVIFTELRSLRAFHTLVMPTISVPPKAEKD